MNKTALETELFIEALKRLHGYDFSSYAKASLTRRILQLQHASKSSSVVAMIEKLFHQPDFLALTLSTLTVSVSELFRDPDVFTDIRQKVLPYLRSFATLNIWLAGVASGEEAYSMAIVLHEEGLLDHTQIYATDICPLALLTAKSGTLKKALNAQDALRYQQSGGKASLSDYFTTVDGASMFKEPLLSSIFFQDHNIVHEAAISSPQLLMCRNVFIYFNKRLQEKVLKKFTTCLDESGFLVIGSKENLNLSKQYQFYHPVSNSNHIFQKKYHD